MKRQFRRQPFILLSFSSSKKARKAQETQSYQRFQCIGHTDFKGLSNAVTNTPTLLPSMGTTRQKSSCRNRLQNGPRSLSRVKVGTHSALGERSHTAAYTPKQGAFRMGVLSLPSDCFTRFGNPAWPGGRTANFAAFGSWSGVLSKNAESLRNSDALMRVAAPRRRGPAGLRDLFRFCRNCGLYTLRSVLSMRARWGWYHYPRRALCAVETLGARLSKGFICRFLRLLSSILCVVPFSANMQISLSAISVANAFPPPTTAGLCASSRIASNRTTTVSLGCMDSSSFGCLIVLDSSSTYTTRS